MGMDGKAAFPTPGQLEIVAAKVTAGQKIARTVFFTAELKRQVTLADRIDRAIAAAVKQEAVRCKREMRPAMQTLVRDANTWMRQLREERAKCTRQKQKLRDQSLGWMRRLKKERSKTRRRMQSEYRRARRQIEAELGIVARRDMLRLQTNNMTHVIGMLEASHASITLGHCDPKAHPCKGIKEAVALCYEQLAWLLKLSGKSRRRSAKQAAGIESREEAGQ